MTFFLYLSDVEEGGATNFPDLKIAVSPKVGKALLWPSVLNSSPKDKEPRTDHEAQDVIKGLKFGANAWIHRELLNYLRTACTLSRYFMLTSHILSTHSTRLYGCTGDGLHLR